MARVKVAPKKAYEEPRIDSGAALSDPAVPSDGPAPNGTLVMPILLKTDWDLGTPKARLRRNDLQLRQPKGFPIKPLKITLDRARKEAAMKALAKDCVDSDFEAYEEFEKVGEVKKQIEVEGKDDDEEAEDTADEELEGSVYDSADGSANDSDDSYELPATRVVTEKSAALVDSRGRTRAATNRRKAQEVSDATCQTSV
ncbi:uncharacterized protein J4E88_001289 [Alternaria novae-zelandiae]|uniref:uncharacterized protein n=1 Tax=Alternaria triticimaculans TaxID=297637 RepID=UPI0020C30A12|nr:uncharacterized protein J4E78_002208 [Alternaria triticimaculans]XP_049248898.1 uncharacterized protein J4E84_000744 [Alternaria hordeiaustralica]XP_049258823.1 uncharacterized protein J4E88_001289 [Alternaria novae-zelandiae]XP_051325560.1 uncharacterized protein J4E85_005830 [Alternaria conjuncta]XP_051349848.1 uncharacterized protein J4E92_008483 [Alternaria infectoria]KAI4691613.1 hypothetical protein J4E81_007139 [Alternaria sp. BMP 2799]KAI4668382.1 hypothetical protein J4E78_002208 